MKAIREAQRHHPLPQPPHRLATMCVVHMTLGIPRRTDLSKNGHLADARSSLPDSLYLLQRSKRWKLYQ
jgi:hypothetical protein